MGQAPSRNIRQRDPRKGIIVTFDALGTLYNFKEPVGQQYLRVAQRCGVSGVKADDVTRAFKTAYKSHVEKFPNYGKGTLEDPRVWWTQLVNDTFRPLTENVPDDLGPELYKHFSSGDAYELYPDVRPLLENVKHLRQQYSGANDPTVILGVITNSDPRVRNVLKSLSLDFGDVSNEALWEKVGNQSREIMKSRSPESELQVPWDESWRPTRDFDFVTTSYEADAEKPSSTIFFQAERQATIVMLGKLTTDTRLTADKAGFQNALKVLGQLNASRDMVRQMQWIHVGDERGKDFEAAKKCGLEAFLVKRDGCEISQDGVVSSLDEVATIVSVLAREAFEFAE